MVNILARQMSVEVLTGAEMLNGKDLLGHSKLCLKVALRNSYQANMSSQKAEATSSTEVEMHSHSHQNPKGKTGTRLNVI